MEGLHESVVAQVLWRYMDVKSKALAGVWACIESNNRYVAACHILLTGSAIQLFTCWQQLDVTYPTAGSSTKYLQGLLQTPEAWTDISFEDAASQSGLKAEDLLGILKRAQGRVQTIQVNK